MSLSTNEIQSFFTRGSRLKKEERNQNSHWKNSGTDSSVWFIETAVTPIICVIAVLTDSITWDGPCQPEKEVMLKQCSNAFAISEQRHICYRLTQNIMNGQSGDCCVLRVFRHTQSGSEFTSTCKFIRYISVEYK